MSFGKHFKDSDFTLYEKGGDIFSLQMKFDNFFRNQNLPAMIGGSKKNHPSINDGLSVPLGLAMLNNQLNLIVIRIFIIEIQKKKFRGWCYS